MKTIFLGGIFMSKLELDGIKLDYSKEVLEVVNLIEQEHENYLELYKSDRVRYYELVNHLHDYCQGGYGNIRMLIEQLESKDRLDIIEHLNSM